MKMRYLKTLALALLLAALSATAFAQSGICPANTLGHAPKPKTTLPYTIGQNDGCKTLIFNSASAGAVNIPAPGTAGGFYSSFFVVLFNEGAGTLTLTPTINNAATLPTINGVATITLAQGQGATLALGDDGNWYASTTGGTLTSPLASFGNAAGAPTHIATQQLTPPALTSCGTTPAITGTDSAGTVTMGTTATGCVITFNVAYTAVPTCVVNWIATPLASQSYAVTATAITLTQTSTSNNKATYVCFAQSGG
jgi:hypothetical protein